MGWSSMTRTLIVGFIGSARDPGADGDATVVVRGDAQLPTQAAEPVGGGGEPETHLVAPARAQADAVVVDDDGDAATGPEHVHQHGIGLRMLLDVEQGLPGE